MDKPNLTSPFWTQEQEDKLKELCESGKYKSSEIATILGRTTCGIQKYCYKRGIKNRRKKQSAYTYNKNYFSNTGLDQCYWAGILQTDGCLYYKGSLPAIQWNCSDKDYSHMDLFTDMIGFDKPISRYRNCCSLSKDPTKKRGFCRIMVQNAKEWERDLKENFGFTANKMLRNPPPNLATVKQKMAYQRFFEKT